MAIPTELISALIGAVSGGGVAWLAHRQDTYNARVQEAHRALLDLVELRGQMLDGTGLTPERMEVLVQRRALLLAVAERLIRRTAKGLTAHDWIALGCESLADRDFTCALQHFERAVRVSRSDDLLTQAVALRNLGGLRYTAVGRDRDPTAGAAAFERAVALTSEIDDGYMLYNTGLSFDRWGTLEASVGAVQAQKRLEAAAECYRGAVAHGYLPAGQALSQLEAREQIAAGMSAPTAPRGWSGEPETLPPAVSEPPSHVPEHPKPKTQTA